MCKSGPLVLLASWLGHIYMCSGARSREVVVLDADKHEWPWSEDSPLSPLKAWLKANETGVMEENGSFGGVNTTLKVQVSRGQYDVKLFSHTNPSKPAKCMNMEVDAPRLTMYMGWIGNEDPSNPCAFSMKTMVDWIEEMADWGKKNGYTRFGCTDMARGVCKYKVTEKNGSTSIGKLPSQWIKGSIHTPEWYWQGRAFVFTPMTLIKYGQPFYTKSTGVFPADILKQPLGEGRTRLAREFCEKSAKVRDWGDQPLTEVLKAVGAKGKAVLEKAVAMMHGGKGPKETDTFKDLFLDKKLWTSVKEDESECTTLGKTSAMLLAWQCPKEAPDDWSAELYHTCLEYKALATWMTTVSFTGYDRSLNEVENDELVCDFYDRSWKLAFDSRWGGTVRSIIKTWSWVTR